MLGNITEILASKYQSESLASLYLINYSCTDEELKSWQSLFLESCKIQLNHPDVLNVFIDQNDQRYFVESESIEEMFNFINFKPVSLKKKLVFINQAELLGTIVSNKFLKVFEELPSYITLFLLTNNLGSILPTVASRAIKIKINNHKSSYNNLKIPFVTPQQAISSSNTSAHWIESEKEILNQIIQDKINDFSCLNFFECQNLIKLLKTNHQATIYNTPKLSRITHFFS